MKKNTYILKLISIYILLLLVFIGFNFEIEVRKYRTTTEYEDKILSSIHINKLDNVEDFDNNNDNIKDSITVLAEETINLSHYGQDCYGCTTGYTASGYYVGDGRIHYEDPVFGTVRVVAADRKYPLGSIVRINYYDNVITAIVLDRGSAIGDGKKFQIDLLVSSENESYELGIIRNTNLEVLRFGY